jgi:hypothetical protein
MTQAQAGMQECLVVFARSVEVLHQPPKARAIEVQERGPNVAPRRRGILATDHDHEPFKGSFMSELLGWLKIHDLLERSRLFGSTMPNQWHMLSSPVTEEYDHAGSSECCPDAP